MVKRVFRYLLLFEQEGNRTIAEFDVHEEYEEFQKELDEKEILNQLINEREMERELMQGAQYVDMRE
ncbi:MAG: hypothetical protein COV66_01995 [Nitrospinae bacterium CG11_big_fil_rev_8_21_14_0_20_45_15]|nr:MAG: hypothetical protein COV66_01995 [Nitrospinae bacterium CG11_big_fil_rev_8_21_14_0_20_45_15]